MESQKTERIVTWLKKNGGSIQDHVEIVHTREYGYHLKALKDFDHKQAVVDVPRVLTISIATISRAQSHWPAEFLSHYAKEPYIITRFLLMDEFLYKDNSWWYPYISLLPQPSEDTEEAPFDTPLWFNEQEINWIKGTSLEAATRQRYNAWLAEYRSGLSHLKSMSQKNSYSWYLYKWAATVLSSRCFPNKAPEEIKKSYLNDESHHQERLFEKSHEIADNFPVLVPVLDLANHDPNLPVTWIINDYRYSFYTSINVDADCQIYNNYGAKGNEELLMGYGFTIPANPADVLGLRLPNFESLQSEAAERISRGGRILPLKITATDLDLEQSSLTTEFTLMPDTFYIRPGTLFPSKLLDAVRLSVANDRELKEFDRSKTWKSLRLQIQADGQIMLALASRHRSLSQCESLQPQTINTVGRRRAMAKTYVHGLLEIVVSHMQALASHLSLSTLSKQILTLQHALDSTPLWLRVPLRQLSKAVCGTRSHWKIDQKGFHEEFMVIAICISWMHYSLSLPKAYSESDGEADSGWLAERLEQWFVFLRKTYCPPAGWSGSCMAMTCHCSEMNDSEQLQRPLDPNKSLDHPILASALSIVQRGLVLHKLESSLGDSRLWTKDLVSWGYQIWSSEAVTIPSYKTLHEDHAPDIENVRALFLETMSDELSVDLADDSTTLG